MNKLLLSFTLLLTAAVSYGQCNKPTVFTTTATTANSASFSWVTGGSNMWQIEYGPIGFTVGNGTKINVTTNPYTLTGLSGATYYSVYIRDTCASGSVSGWFGPFTFFTKCSGAIIAPYVENFDNHNHWIKPVSFNTSGSIKLCWSRTPSVNEYLWIVGPPQFSPFQTGPNGDHTGGGQYLFTETIGALNNTDAILRSPRIDISNLSNPELTFWYHMFGNHISELRIEGLNTNTSSWQTLEIITGQQQNSKSSPWKETSVSLASLNADTVFIRFVGVRTGSFGTNSHIAIDDLKIAEGPTCPKPTNVQLVSKTATSITMDWVTGGANNWQVEFGINPLTQGNGTIAHTTTNSFTATNLSPNTTYTFYVRDSCGANDKSSWVGPFNFKTECAPISAPLKENFDGNNFSSQVFFNVPGIIDACWKRSGTSSYFWDVGPPIQLTPFTGPGTDHTTGSGQFLFTEMFTPFSTSNDALLTTRMIDLSNLTLPELSFYYHMFGQGIGTLYVDVDDGSGWSNVFMTHGQQQLAQTDPWKEAVVNLDSYANDTIQIRFRASTLSFNNNEIAIDDLDIHEKPTCAKPTGFAVDLEGANWVDLSWTTGGASNWLIKYKSASGSQTIVTTNSNPTRVNSLSANTEYEVWVRDSCAAGDVSDWVGPLTFRTKCLPVSIPYTQDFESSAFAPAVGFNTSSKIDNCYDRELDDFFMWEVGPSQFGSFNSGPSGDHTTGSGQFMFSDAKSFLNNIEITDFYTPYIDLTNTISPELTFWYHMYGSDIGGLKVFINDGGGWINIWSKQGQQQVSKTDSWKEAIISLGSYAGDTVILRFESTTGNIFAFDVNAAIDDISIKDLPTCPMPQAIQVLNKTSSSATLGWTTGGASNWLIKYKPIGGSPAITATSNNPYVLGGLSPNTVYQVWIKDSCGVGDVSFWEGPIEFKTSCATSLLPFIENFDGSNWGVQPTTAQPGSIDDCWDRSDTTRYFWNPGDGISGTMSGTGPSAGAGSTGKFAYAAYRNGFTNQSTELFTPWIFIGSALQPRLALKYHMYGNTIASLKIFVQRESGAIIELDSIVGQQQTSSTDSWLSKLYILNSFIGDTVRIIFRARKIAGFQSEIAIDDIEIYDYLCSDPSNLAVSAITSTTVEVSWDGVAPQSNVQYDISGFTLGTGMIDNNATSIHTLSGLQPATTYDVYIQDSCFIGSSSNWVGPITFTTDCGGTTADISIVSGGLQVTLDATNSNGLGLSYSWNFGDGNGGLDSIEVHNYGAAGTYTVQLIVIDSCGNADTTQQDITVCDLPTAFFTYSINGNTVDFDASTSLGAVSYSWDFDNGTTSTASSPSVTYATKDTYTITLIVENSCGDKDTLVQVINLCDKPVASFTFNIVSSGGGGMIVDFNATSSTNATSYFWEFGDGNTNSTSAIPQHTYSVPGLFYEVTLIVYSSCGTSDTVKMKLSEVSIEETLLDKIKLYPNPTSSYTDLQGFEGNWNDTEIVTYSLEGKVLDIPVEYIGNKARINLSTLPNGTYLVWLNYNGYQKTFKIIRE